VEKDLGKLDMSEQCALAVPEDNRSLGSMQRSVASRPREVILPIYSAFMRCHLEFCIQMWGPQYKTDMDLLE